MPWMMLWCEDFKCLHNQHEFYAFGRYKKTRANNWKMKRKMYTENTIKYIEKKKKENVFAAWISLNTLFILLPRKWLNADSLLNILNGFFWAIESIHKHGHLLYRKPENKYFQWTMWSIGLVCFHFGYCVPANKVVICVLLYSVQVDVVSFFSFLLFLLL